MNLPEFRSETVTARTGDVAALIASADQLHRAGRLEEAAVAYRRALTLGGVSPEVHYNLGVTLHRDGRLEDAVGAYRAALAALPAHIPTLRNLAVVLQGLGRHSEAIDCYRRALEVEPQNAALYTGLACVLQASGDIEAACEVYEMAIRLQPEYAEAHSDYGVALKTLGRLEQAAVQLRRAVELRPQYPEALNNLGNTLKLMGGEAEAIDCYRRALEVRPRDAPTYVNLANALQSLGRFDDALEFYEVALTIEPEQPEAHWNRALLRLQRGDFERGWEEYEWGFAAGERPRRAFSQPRWQGDELAGRRILVWAEQGFGDAIQFLRYLPLVRRRGGQVILECPSALVALAVDSGLADQVLEARPDGVVDCHFDVQIPLLSLPRLFALDVNSMPDPDGYLRADPERARRWRERLGPHTRPRVGLVWSGNVRQRVNRQRACGLAEFDALSKCAGITWVSLQKGPAVGQAAQGLAGLDLVDYTDQLDDFAETAALIVNLDLVISVDTAVVHLAGALGKPIWTLLSMVPDWRWLLDRSDSPWYRSMRLFRQRTAGDWVGVFGEVRQALLKWSGSAHSTRQDEADNHLPEVETASRDRGRLAFNRIHGVTRRDRCNSARAILPPLLEIFQSRSMLDVGCGFGVWLQVAREHGVREVFGVDGEWIDPKQVDLPKGAFRCVDLERPFDLERQFDLIVSLEVAEHLPPERADGFVDDLVRHGDVVLFSAAVPGQRGNGHVNEQFQHYWAERFLARGFAAIDAVRPAVWLRPDVFWWLQQNIILYVRADRLAQWPVLRPWVVERLPSLSVIHPQLYGLYRQEAEKAQVRSEVTEKDGGNALPEGDHGRTIEVRPGRPVNGQLLQLLQVALSRHEAGDVDGAAQLLAQGREIDADHGEVLHLSGLVALEQGNLGQALVHLNRATERLPNVPMVWETLAEAYGAVGQTDSVLHCRRRLCELQPDNAEAWHALGEQCTECANLEAAAEAYQRALGLKSTLAGTWNNLGNVRRMQGRGPEALTCYGKALELKPDFAEAHYNTGAALRARGRLAEARAAFASAVDCRPDYVKALVDLVCVEQELCHWEGREVKVARVLALTEQQIGAGRRSPLEPFSALTLVESPAVQRVVAESAARAIAKATAVRGQGPLHRIAESARPGRLKIGYVSSDFRDHATAYLISSLFGLHDRDRFEIHAYSFGPDDGSDYRGTIAAGCDHFTDIEGMTPMQSARRIADDGIHILIDLKGYTRDVRPETFALRPAPLQVNWLGFPGTLGADYIDYIVTDAVVSPPDQVAHLSEAPVYMPHSYQVNNPWQPVDACVTNRAQWGLPEDSFVFCCFNASYKIEPRMFTIWMRILDQVPGSVLWLLDDGEHVKANLAREAQRRGIAPARLVFAPRAPRSLHLARHQCADLFLDTLPCNAHTTASDALRAGLPLITCPGETFASRVAASLLHAVGLPELVARDLEHYEQMAVELAFSREQALRIRQRLASLLSDAALFDGRRFVRNFEQALLRMWERRCAGHRPAPIVLSEGGSD